jgi:membrane-associated phospholipid phosphatase
MNRFHSQNQEHNWKVTLFDAGSSLVLNGVVTFGVKYGVNRKRPFDTYSGYYSPAYLPQDPSFPSGHTSTAFQWATSFSLRNKEWYWVIPAYLYASSIAYTRLALGVHYPTDVLGGVVCGVTSGLVSHWFVNKIAKSKNEPSLKLKD